MAYWQQRNTRLHRLLGVALACLTLTLSGSAQTPPVPPAPKPQAHPLDQPLHMLYEARKVHQGLRDYTCYLISQEKVKGKLLPENVMLFLCRPQPFSVYMRWMAPKDLAGQEVAYIQGRNKDKMRVHPKKGFPKLVGWVSVDPRDPRVFDHSNHTIHEAGIGNSIEQLIRHVEMERQVNKTQVTLAPFTYNNRRCDRIELTRTERHANFGCYRTVVYIDQQYKLPVRVENYEWPYQGGPAGGALLESFSYVNLEFNKGYTDAPFTK